MIAKEVAQELRGIRRAIDKEEVSYEELAYLTAHRQEVLAFGDIVLAESAGISEDEWRDYWQVKVFGKKL